MATFSKNNAAKPPIPTKVNVTNGSKGEWTPETDNLKETQVRFKIIYVNIFNGRQLINFFSKFFLCNFVF